MLADRSRDAAVVFVAATSNDSVICNVERASFLQKLPSL